MVRIQANAGNGSGAIFEIQGQTAFIITNLHVIKGAGQVNVIVNDTTTYRGTVWGTDPVRDLAVVSICCGSFETIPFGDASLLEPGDTVFALGYPLGIAGQATLTQGIVSAIRYDSNYQSDVIQTDAAINPGNSGGPMISASGDVVGINTYKYSVTGVEGLGFAVPSSTVQEQIPAMRATQPQATPTPGPPRPTSTPSVGPYDFGPVNGELVHNPTGSYIETEFAESSFSDMILEATFVNPFSAAINPWDYGFFLRDDRNDSNGALVQVVVSSDGRWRVALQENGVWQQIGGGTVDLDTDEGGQNHLRVVAIRERGWLFVNREYAGSFDFGSSAMSGDVAVITGAFLGGQLTGYATKFENFTINRLTKRYGPTDDSLQEAPGSVSTHGSGIFTRDLVAEVEFNGLPGADWNYGFIIRNPYYNRLDAIGLTGEQRWFHTTRNTADLDYFAVADGELDQTLRQRNNLLLIAVQESGWFFLNGQLVAKLSLAVNQDYGEVSASGEFDSEKHGPLSFEDFTVWAP